MVAAADATVRAGSRPQALRPGDVAWIALVPCTLVVLAAIVVLGPPLGHAFLGPGSETLWPPNTPNTIGRPEPVKHARYLLALLGPVLLAGAVLASGRRSVALTPRTRRLVVAAAQGALVAFAVAAVLGQKNVLLPATPPLQRIFTNWALAAAVALPALLLAAARRTGLLARVARLARETPARRIAALLVAVVLTALWVVQAVDTERTIGHEALGDLLTWTMDDPFAVLDGRTPLVDFHPLYAQLWPYLSAGWLSLAGTTVTAFTLLLTTASALALLAVYAVFRRVVRSSLLALALYVPFVATGFLSVFNLTNADIFSMWPLRYGGAYAIAWLTSRHADGSAPRRAWPLLLAAGLVAADNAEFGLAALVATVVALACAPERRSWRALGRLVATAGAGLLAAGLLVSLITLARSGSLPDFGLVSEFPRIYGVVGLVSLPMPILGVHLLVFATFVAAIAVAAVRIVGTDDQPLLTSMLAWTGTFGVLAGSYYVGRSDSLKLLGLFSAWSFALGLLTVVVVRNLHERAWRRPQLAELLVLAGFAATVCSVTDLPAPWAQVSRLRDRTPTAVYRQADAVRFVAAHTHRGNRVALLTRLGHRIAYDAGVEDVSPYPLLAVIVTRRQMRTFLDAVLSAHAHAVFVEDKLTAPPYLATLAAIGFSRRAGAAGFSEWRDDR